MIFNIREIILEINIMNRTVIDDKYVNNKIQNNNIIDINYLKKCIAEKDMEILELKNKLAKKQLLLDIQHTN